MTLWACAACGKPRNEERHLKARHERRCQRMGAEYAAEVMRQMIASAKMAADGTVELVLSEEMVHSALRKSGTDPDKLMPSPWGTASGGKVS